MSTDYKGFVARINAKSGKGKNPPFRAYTSYSFKVEKDDGSEHEGWFSFGFKEPPFKEGDYISFKAEEQRGYLTVVDGSGSVVKNPPARASAKASAAATPASVGTSSRAFVDAVSGADRQTQIVMQHSQEMAIQLVSVLLANNALPVSGASTKAGEAKRYDEITAFVNKLTVQLYNDVVTGRLLTTVADTVTVTKADGPIPEVASGKDSGDRLE